MDAVSKLESIVVEVCPSLEAIPEEQTVITAPGKWSKRQELGHLVDSACNNHQRIVRTLLEEQPSLPGYDGDRWVTLHRYQELGWKEIVQHWRVMNQQLIRAARSAVNSAGLARKLILAGKPVTLDFIVNDYVRHLLHHLRHIGIDVEQT